MARFGQSFKDKAMARLLPPECAAVEIVAREACIGMGTLLRWREQLLGHEAGIAGGGEEMVEADQEFIAGGEAGCQAGADAGA